MKACIDVELADDLLNEWGHDISNGDFVLGVDKDGIYTDRYQVRTYLVPFESCEYCQKTVCNCEEIIDDGIQNNENR